MLLSKGTPIPPGFRIPKPDEWNKYINQIYESGGFDIPDYPGPRTFSLVHPMKNFKHDRKLYESAHLAIRFYNKTHCVDYKLVDIDKANKEGAAIAGMIYYITFKAESSLGVVQTFQARVFHSLYEDQHEVNLVRLKPTTHNCTSHIQNISSSPMLSHPNFGVFFNKSVKVISNSCEGFCHKGNSKLCIGISSEANERWVISLGCQGNWKKIVGTELYSMDTFSSSQDKSLSIHFLEALITGLYMTKHQNSHVVYIVTDNFFSHLWHCLFAELNTDQEWKSILHDSLTMNCSIIWHPTDVESFDNLQDYPVESVDQTRGQ